LRPRGRFDAEIRSGEERIRLGTFDTAHEAAWAYDAVAWRLGRSRRAMNFHDVFTREQAEMLAPPPPMITRKEQRRQRELEQRLLIAERDEAFRVEWARRFPEDVAATAAFYAEKEKKEEEKAAEKAAKKASREKRRAEIAKRKAARAAKAARKAEEKKNGTGPSTVVVSSSSSSFEWTTTPVSETRHRAARTSTGTPPSSLVELLIYVALYRRTFIIYSYFRSNFHSLFDLNFQKTVGFSTLYRARAAK
jgi:hypothetical protein